LPGDEFGSEGGEHDAVVHWGISFGILTTFIV
jgi:hypothetical protein